MAEAYPEPAEGYKKKYTFFWRSNNEFSQWHKSNFWVKGVKYCCAEQYMMHQKALLFNDEDTANLVLKTDSPRKQKSLGRKVKNFNENTWLSKREGIVRAGNIAKFTQNGELKKKLSETAGTYLVEASPYDTIWGIGLSEDDPQAHDEKLWRGQNLLGKILTQVREELLAQESL